MSWDILYKTVAAPPPVGAPAWFSALSHKQWTAPVSNWLGDPAVRDPNYNVQPYIGTTGHQSLIKSYCGMGIDNTRGGLFDAGSGGHNDYAGNEVYWCLLRAESPAWVRLRNASGPPVPNDEQVHQIWADGTPPSDHTCNYQIEVEGRWIKVGLGSPNWLGSPAGTRGWEFDYVNKVWIDNGNIWLQDNYGLVGCGVWDSVNRHIIKITPSGNPMVQFMNPDTMTQVKTAGNSDIASSSVITADIEPNHRTLVWRTGDDYTNFLFCLDLNNTASGWYTAPMSGTAPGHTHRFWWHEASQAFLSWDNTLGLVKLVLSYTGSTVTGAVWSQVSGVTGTNPVMDADSSGGMWSRQGIIRDMGNGEAAFFAVPTYSFPDVYVMRLAGAV
jgi:hypothetical protein